MNPQLLYWVRDEVHDPKFYHITNMHADTDAKYFICVDGASKHIIEFNADTGKYLYSVGG